MTIDELKQNQDKDLSFGFLLQSLDSASYMVPVWRMVFKNDVTSATFKGTYLSGHFVSQRKVYILELL